MEFKRLSRRRNELRLVRFELDNDTSDIPSLDKKEQQSPISLRLEHKSRRDVEYAALSYVWGDGIDQCRVSINGVAVSIFRNLYEALHQLLRQRVKSWLWIDAICINQQDDEEKSWQVNDMRAVFEEAQLVYYCLGPSANDSDFVMDQLKWFGREACEARILEFSEHVYQMHIGDPQGIHVLRHLEQYFPDLVSGPGLDAPTFVRDRDRPNSILCRGWAESGGYSLDAEHIGDINKAGAFLVKLAKGGSETISSSRMSHGLESLLLRDFWSRIWIIQELALSRNGTIFCGDRFLPVEYFNSALLIGEQLQWALRNLRNQRRQNTPMWTLNGHLFKLHGMRIRRRRKTMGLPTCLSILLAGVGYADRPAYLASNPRDVIFGLIGVICDAQELDIRADYAKSAIEVFTEVTRAFWNRQRGRNQYLLGYSTFPKDIEGLPSWVPDWSRLGRVGITRVPFALSWSFRASLNADQLECQPLERKCSNILRLKGFRKGRVVSTSQLLRLETGPGVTLPIRPSNQGPARDLWRKAQIYCYENGVEDDKPILRTCLTDDGCFLGFPTRLNNAILNLAQKVFRDDKMDIKDLSSEDIELICKFKGLKHLGRSSEPSLQNGYEDFAFSVLFRMSSALGERRLFVTEEGSLGLAPSYIKAGDLVVIIFGYEAPVILRPENDIHLSFVGDAYVDGIMYGEAMEGQKIEDDEVFEII
ncbi:Fc.00g058520.m01.CDS01 [Cosmosporella sp. VM-42]